MDGTADGEDETVVRADDGSRAGVGRPVCALGARVRLRPSGLGVVRRGDADGVGSDGGVLRCGGPLAGGGASGTVGDTGASDTVGRSGSTKIAAAAAQARPAPAAVRSTLRRAAPRRIASYRPVGGPR